MFILYPEWGKAESPSLPEDPLRGFSLVVHCRRKEAPVTVLLHKMVSSEPPFILVQMGAVISEEIWLSAVMGHRVRLTFLQPAMTKLGRKVRKNALRGTKQPPQAERKVEEVSSWGSILSGWGSRRLLHRCVCQLVSTTTECLTIA